MVRPQLLAVLLTAVLVIVPTRLHSPDLIMNSSLALVTPARQTRLRQRITDHRAVLAAATIRPDSPDCGQQTCLALTFDDGPNPITTPQILAELEAAQVPATFFVVGSRVPGNEAILQRMHADGDQIGNHSWNHPDLTRLSSNAIRTQIMLTQQAVVNAGVPAPTVFRPPYGAINPTVEQVIPLSILLWNEDPRDWAANRPAAVVTAVEASARPGGIIDMHDIYHVTADALPRILTDLKARGYRFVTVDQLLSLNPSSRGVYYGHP